MNRPKRSVRQHFFLAALFAASLSMLAATSPAAAGHDEKGPRRGGPPAHVEPGPPAHAGRGGPPVDVAPGGPHDRVERLGPDFVCELHDEGACLPSCRYPHRGPYAQRQYDKGYYAGRDDGWYEGYYDGLYGRRYCDLPRYKIRRHSRHFRNGYIDGFADAYEQGFRRGDRKRHLRRGWHGRWCSCCR